MSLSGIFKGKECPFAGSFTKIAQKLTVVLWGIGLLWIASLARGEPIARATFVQEPPELDGLTDDPVWQLAEPVDSFVQIRPFYGRPASERTQVRVVYTETHLYVAFDCFVSDPGSIVANTTQRDEGFFLDDHVGVLLDTFYDRRNAYAFYVNPLGTQRDMRITNEGLTQRGRGPGGGDTSWDATWEAAVARLEDRWSVEMAIPFAEMRFANDRDRWGVNFWRSIESREEEDSWADVGSREYSVSRFGTLIGIDPSRLDRGPRLWITPYGTLSPQSRTGGSWRLSPKTGLDLRYPLAEATLDITLNPDFAQIEADPGRVNLSDIELRLQEKRPFFLEGGELYRTPLELFYSRRIEDLKLGAKLAGRFGGQEIAAVTAEAEPLNEEAFQREGRSNFTAIRYRRTVNRWLDVGLLGTNRIAWRSNRINGAAGLDGTARLPGEITLLAQYSRSWTDDPGDPHDSSDDVSWRGDHALLVHAERRGPNSQFEVNYMDVGPHFEVDSGFIPRVDRRGFSAEGGLGFRSDKLLNNLWARANYERLTDSTGRLTNERVEVGGRVGIGDFFAFFSGNRYYHLDEELNRTFQDETVDLFTGWFPPRYVGIRLFQNIGYRNGERSWFLSPELTLRPTESWSLELSAQRELRRKTGQEPWKVANHIVRLSSRYRFTLRTFLSGSYETNRDGLHRFFLLLGTEYRPKSYLFIVFQRNRFLEGETPETREEIVENALFLKLSYQLGVL
ncbi:MAG: hypothetical protein KatS3mg115_1723 [Candidatus Poribacteria bacterium]|nr:MAG: hypothetical protein KatS3mg115_1723 [Candidatus Poribacteria bacterium]